MGYTLEDLKNAYLRSRTLMDDSVKRVELVVKQFAMHINDDGTLRPVRLRTIQVEHILSWRERRMASASAATVNTDRRHLSTLFNYGIQLQWLSANPMLWIRPAPKGAVAPKSLPHSTLAVYVDLLTTAHWYDSKGKRHDEFHPQRFWLIVLQTLYYTGMRRRQLVGLRWGDVDFERGAITLRAATSKTRREWSIPMADELRPMLMDLLAQTSAIRNLSQERMRDMQVFCLPLFSTRPFVRNEMTSDNVSAFFQRLSVRTAKSRTDVGRISSHRIRHTTATHLANSVPNIKVVQQLLGHTSVHTTLGYVHPTLAAMRDAVGRLNLPTCSIGFDEFKKNRS